jgi:hypothetical protein
MYLDIKFSENFCKRYVGPRDKLFSGLIAQNLVATWDTKVKVYRKGKVMRRSSLSFRTDIHRSWDRYYIFQVYSTRC